MPKPIFVFGSNTAGIHGAGAARLAYEKKGARWHQGVGLSGNSYAIPTKLGRDGKVLETLSLERIRQYVQGFLAFAADHPELTFQVTRIGCGLAGLKDEDIAPMFYHATNNCEFDTAWCHWLPDNTNYWGTF